jgi:membrane protease YdiL (CAAX protease family)
MNPIRRVFFGPAELRAGWRLLIFVVIAEAAVLVTGALSHPLGGHLNSEESRAIARSIGTVIPLLVAAAIMAKIERRKMADYGLPWRGVFGKQFWQGVLIGFPTITALVAALLLAGVLSFTEGTPKGSVIWLYAVGYALFFVVGALLEEFLCRGYLLFTLTTGVGFWPAAVLSSILFGLLHAGNPGETAIGCVSTGVFGLLFCFMLRRSGNLWMPLGFHAAYHWGEAFFYGTPDSGTISPERVLTAKLSGPNWLTGGSAGPEGSYLCFAILALVAIGFGLWQRDVKYPNPAALRRTPPAPTPIPVSQIE